MSDSFRLSVDIRLREKSMIALVIALLIPNTFYWAGFNFNSDPFTADVLSNALDYATQSTSYTFSVLSYLALFAALVQRNRPQIRSLMIVLATVFQLLSITQFIISALNAKVEFLDTLQIVFVYSDNFFPFQLFNTIALIPLFYLFRQNLPWLRSEVSRFIPNLREPARNLKSVLAIVVAILLAIFVLFAFYTNINDFIDFNDTFLRGFHPELILAALVYLLDLVVTTVFIAVLIVYLYNHFDRIAHEVKELNTVLRDFKLSTYVTRQISGYLYWFYYVVIVGVFALIGPFQTLVAFEQTRQDLDSGLQPQLLLILVGGPLLTLLVGYFIILILRLVFEILIALIHIAQNTARARV